MVAKASRAVLCSFVLAGLMAAGNVQAAPASTWLTEPGFLGVWRAVAEWLDFGWVVDPERVGHSEKAGCDMDPDGHLCPTQTVGDEGCDMDPFGRCVTSAAGIESLPTE